MPETARPQVSFPRLDALRAACFLAVFLFHGFHTELPALRGDPWWARIKYGVFGMGHLGVNVFFTLSGFLITYLLITERSHFGRIDVPRFWLRRILRIWPLYFACVAFGFLVFPLIKQAMGRPAHEPADPLYYLLFVSNFDRVSPDASNLALLWSIAVEEQFYLAWPVLLAILPVRWYPLCFGGVIVQSLIVRGIHASSAVNFHHTLSCIGDMAVGALAAWYGHDDGIRSRIARVPLPAWAAVYAAFAAVFAGYQAMEGLNLAGLMATRTLFAALAALILLHQCFGMAGPLSLPRSGLLSRLGRISYGLYCLHTIGLLSAIELLRMAGLDRHLWQVFLLQPMVGLCISILLATASHRLLERPFLQLKDRSALVRRSVQA